jgi:hypothetical protein
MPKQITCTDYCNNFKPSASKSITYTEKLLQIVDCYFKQQLSNVLKMPKPFLFLALQVLGYSSLVLKPNFVCYSRKTKTENGLCCLHFTIFINQALVLRPNCVPKIVGGNKKGVNKNKIPIKNNDKGRD